MTSRINRPSGMQKAFKAGLPLFVLLIGSVYGIQTFLQTQIEMKGIQYIHLFTIVF